MSEPVLPEGLTAAQKREKYQEANEKAINTLDTLYEELRIKRIGAAARRRSAWVPHLKLAFEKGKLEKREKEKWRHELNLVRAGVVNGWIKQLEAVKESKVFHSESLDRFPKGTNVYREATIGPLLARDYDFYRFYLKHVEEDYNLQEIVLEPLQSGHAGIEPAPRHPGLLKKLRSHLSLRSLKSNENKRPIWLSKHDHLCYRISQETWESVSVDHALRAKVFTQLPDSETNNDGAALVSALEAVIEAANPHHQMSFSHRAPLGYRQAALYYT
ncbi:hypothetical protein JCM16303_005197 [Sporobolomyces ruberrimus]